MTQPGQGIACSAQLVNSFHIQCMLIYFKNLRCGFAATFNTVRRIAHFFNLKRILDKLPELLKKKCNVDGNRIEEDFGDSSSTR